jgi:hypothetical protein
MNWQPVNNDNDILQDGDMFRLWQSDSAWSSWARVQASIGMTLRDFVAKQASSLPLRWTGVNPAAMVEVRRPVTGGGV